MNPYETIMALCKERNVPITVLEKELGFSRGSIIKLKEGRKPSGERLQKIADRFNVTVEYLMTGKEPETYYLNEETAMIAQEVFDNANLRVLFDAARDARPEDIKMVAEMLKRLKETNPDG